MCTCCSTSALSAARIPNVTITGAPTPTTSPSPGVICVVIGSMVDTVVYVPLIGVVFPAEFTATPLTL